MNNERKSLLPLIEILISTGIFAIAVILTLQMFMLARFLGIRTSDTADAILKVQHVAETVKSFESEDEIYDFLKNHAYIDNFFSSYEALAFGIYYDINWEQTDNKDEAVYVTNIYMDRNEEYAGNLYNYYIDLYKLEPYPFINDRAVKENPDYMPLLASIKAGKFILDY